MNHAKLKVDLDIAIEKYKKNFDKLQKTHSYCSEEIQSSINSLGCITLEALENFKTAILNSVD